MGHTAACLYDDAIQTHALRAVWVWGGGRHDVCPTVRPPPDACQTHRAVTSAALPVASFFTTSAPAASARGSMWGQNSASHSNMRLSSSTARAPDARSSHTAGPLHSLGGWVVEAHEIAMNTPPVITQPSTLIPACKPHCRDAITDAVDIHTPGVDCMLQLPGLTRQHIHIMGRHVLEPPRGWHSNPPPRGQQGWQQPGAGGATARGCICPWSQSTYGYCCWSLCMLPCILPG